MDSSSGCGKSLNLGQFVEVCFPDFATQLDMHELAVFTCLDQACIGEFLQVVGQGRCGDRES